MKTSLALSNKDRKPLIVLELAQALAAVLSGDDEEMSHDYAENILEKFEKQYGEIDRDAWQKL